MPIALGLRTRPPPVAPCVNWYYQMPSGSAKLGAILAVTQVQRSASSPVDAREADGMRVRFPPPPSSCSYPGPHSSGSFSVQKGTEAHIQGVSGELADSGGSQKLTPSAHSEDTSSQLKCAICVQRGDVSRDLMCVVESWTKLPEAVRTGIVAMVTAAGNP